jgi:alpha-amylase/alpha-mannosidase (GH57 family)
MGDVRLVIHGHFYQPPRENPWTEEVAAEPSAAPFHDWNERIAAECYRPNGWARVLDEHGSVTDIVNNYEHLSFNIGPTLMSWLETQCADVYERVLDADRERGGAIAQAYSHPILPLSNERDVRTQVRWGMADFERRFGRRAQGLWLPETAVNDDVLRVLVEEGVGFTILAPSQALEVRALDGDDGEWIDVSDGSIATGPPHRWFHPDDRDRWIDLVFYDGPISHDLAFGLTGLSSQELVRRVVDAAADGTPVVVATDGETFGHHHKFADRALAYAFTHEASAAGVRVLNTAALVDEVPPTHQVHVRESAWSCAHGVGRWKEDCGCSTGGRPDWNQAWRAPLRRALDVLRDHALEVFERRGSGVLRDPWVARDAYIDVILGRRSIDDFLSEHRGDEHDDVAALTLLEAQRHALLMYTSCGWFFNDLAGIETLQVLRYAARLMDLVGEIGEPAPVDHFLDVLAEGVSNDPDEGDGRAIWHRHVDPTRVDAERVVAHLALVHVLERQDPTPTVGPFDVSDHEGALVERGPLVGCGGRLVLTHRRTRRRTEHVYAAVHMGGLEVFGATRAPDPGRDEQLFEQVAELVSSGARVSTVLRLLAEGVGPREFGLDSALPDAADQLVASAAGQLIDRFAATYAQLYDDHRPRLNALLTAGYPLPPELRAPAEFALAHRLENDIADVGEDASPDSFRAAQETVREARQGGFQLASPRAAALMSRTLLAAAERAVDDPGEERVTAVLGLLRMTRDLGLSVNVDRAQELVFDALRNGRGGDSMSRLGDALGLAVPG